MYDFYMTSNLCYQTIFSNYFWPSTKQKIHPENITKYTPKNYQQVRPWKMDDWKTRLVSFFW